jgi:hypothetical protein
MHNPSTGHRISVDNFPRVIYRFWGLSTDPVDKLAVLWTNLCGGLWIKLWIRGVKSVDKAVDNSVENSGLWISRDLSTIYPQVAATYPQFCPQRRGEVFGSSKADFAGYPHIHRPYYY